MTRVGSSKSTGAASEKRYHYFATFLAQKFHSTGKSPFDDRSWYGRVLVERVEGFATKEEWMRAYDEINDFENY